MRIHDRAIGLPIFLAGLGIVGSALPGLAQVTPDGSLATPTQVTPLANGALFIDRGTPRGTTLFHSFDRFSVGPTESVIFGSGSLYRTIVGRVTGGGQSLLDGTISVQGGANLLLINPAGIRLGDQVRFNMTGGLVLSTAQSARFADGTEFGTTIASGAPALTVAVLPGLQWGTIAPTSTIEAVENLAFPGDLSLVAGRIAVGGFATTGGNLELRSVGDITIAGLDGPNNGLRAASTTIDAGGDLRVTGYINLRQDSLGRAGDVRIGQQIAPRSVTVGGISTRNFNGDGGSIAVTTTGQFRTTGAFGRADGQTLPLVDQPIQPGDRVAIATQARGNGGGITITAGSIVTSAAVLSDSFGTGQAGPIALTSRGALSVQGVIDAGAVNGDGGAVSLVSDGDLLAGDIKTQGRSSGAISLRSGQTLSLLGPISTEALDGSGAVSLTGKTIDLRQTQVTTAGRRGGQVTVTGDRLLLDQSRIVTTAFGDDLARFGDVRLAVGELRAIGPLAAGLTPGAAVGVTTQDLGNNARGGNISLTADRITLTGASLTALNGGAIEIATQQLDLTNGGILLRSGNPAVRAGDLRIEADRIGLNQGLLEASGAAGDGANLRVTARSLSMAGGSSLLASAGYGGGIGSAQTIGSGAGGNLILDLGELTALANDNNDLISRATNPGTGLGGDRGQTKVKGDLLTNFELRSDADLVALFGNGDGLNFRKLGSNDVQGVKPKPPVDGPIEPPIDPPIEPPSEPPIEPPIEPIEPDEPPVDPGIDPVPGLSSLRFIDRPIATIAYGQGCDAGRYWADRLTGDGAPLPGLGAMAVAEGIVGAVESQGGLEEAGAVTIDGLGRPVLVAANRSLAGRGVSQGFRVDCESMVRP
jgi:filamentous hemagglutinin family protein